MYNMSGLYFRMKSCGLVLGGIGFLLLISGRLWSSSSRNMRKCAIGIFAVLACICFSGYYIYVINKPEISVYEGRFIEERRGRYPACWEYVFFNGNGKKPVFYLDSFSKKEVYPDEFKCGDTYSVSYEGRTGIIIAVKKLE